MVNCEGAIQSRKFPNLGSGISPISKPFLKCGKWTNLSRNANIFFRFLVLGQGSTVYMYYGTKNSIDYPTNLFMCACFCLAPERQNRL